MKTQPLARLPAQPEATPIPTDEWPTGDPPASVAEPLADLIAEHAASTDDTDPLGESLALLVIHRGRIVAEQYGPRTTETTELISWSMAKSMMHAVVGIAASDGLVDIDAPVGIDQWAADDPRSTITLRDLLEMRSGLAWNEDYVDDRVSNVIEMLFGTGAADTAGYAASQPLQHGIGEHWCYSSGTTNIISRIVTDVLGGSGAMNDLLHDRLFGPIGMRDARPTFDESGTWVASSYVHTTARDLARFGLLYLRDGTWGEQRILPAGWVESARTTHAFDPESGYGYASHWWTLADGHGTFSCNGYEGQRIQIVPALDLIIVRLGKTPATHYADLRDFLARITNCFACEALLGG